MIGNQKLNTLVDIGTGISFPFVRVIVRGCYFLNSQDGIDQELRLTAADGDNDKNVSITEYFLKRPMPCHNETTH